MWNRSILIGFGAVAGLALGIIALAYASASEPALPAGVLLLLSPGLRMAELLVPGRHESLGWTFGWFLRVAILTNALYYFVLVSCGAYLTKRLLRRSVKA